MRELSIPQHALSLPVDFHQKVCRLAQPMARAPLFSASVAIENRRRHTDRYTKALTHH